MSPKIWIRAERCDFSRGATGLPNERGKVVFAETGHCGRWDCVAKLPPVYICDGGQVEIDDYRISAEHARQWAQALLKELG